MVFLALAVFGLSAPSAAAIAGCRLVKIADMPVTMQGMTPLVTVKINGVDAKLIVDSGTTFSMLTPASAAKFGIRPAMSPAAGRFMGATGEAKIQVGVARDFTLLGATFHDIDFLIGAPQLQAEADGVLGRNALTFDDMEFDLGNGVIRLFRPQGCTGSSVLAYWAGDGAYSVVPIAPNDFVENSIAASATVNGAKISIWFDTGSPRSLLTMRAAKLAGVAPDGAGVVAGGLVGGFGRRLVNTWIAPFRSFEIGGEEIKNTRLRFGDVSFGDGDMLIGDDFFLSHRIYVAKSQDKLYFTYNGGPVFRLDGPVDAKLQRSQADTAAQNPMTALPQNQSSDDEPSDAAGLGRRGAAFAARRDYEHAIADFTRAAELEPNESQYFYGRGLARLANGQASLAMADLDQALKLNPDGVAALMARAQLRLVGKDETGAEADLDQLLKLKPDDVSGLMLRGYLRAKGKDEAGARSDFDAALRLDPTERLPIAEAYTSADLFKEAIAQLDEWIAKQPKDDTRAGALNSRCWARALMGRELDKALADCNTALRLKPGAAQILDSRGLVHLRLGQLDEAIADYDAALGIEPKIAWSLYCRGIAKLRKGLKTEGDADIQAATKLETGVADRANKYGLAP